MNKKLFVKIERDGRLLYKGEVISCHQYGDVFYVEFTDERQGYVYVKQDVDKMMDCTITIYN